MATHSKHYQTFVNRRLHLDADLELVDIIGQSIKKLSKKDGLLFDKLERSKHTVLANRKVSDHNRELAIHLRLTLYSSYVKDLYEEVTQFLKSALTEAAIRSRVDPGRFIGEHKFNVSVAEVLNADRLETLITSAVNGIFRQLENERSTTTLITKTCNKLGIDVDPDIKNKAIYFLEIRHQFVHADGKADVVFQEKHPDIPYTTDGYIDLKYPLICDIRNAVQAFIDEFDDKALANGINVSFDTDVKQS